MKVICALDPQRRLIEWGGSWILQRRRSSRWKSFAYCGTKEGLLLRLPSPISPEAQAIIDALPDFCPKNPADESATPQAQKI
jgi:hypothetical protein